MAREVELATLDGRYESYRLRQHSAEARLLASIAERGIAEPLEGVEAGRAPCAAQRVQAVALRAQAGAGQRAVRVAGGRRGAGDRGVVARLQRPGACRCWSRRASWTSSSGCTG